MHIELRTSTPFAEICNTAKSINQKGEGLVYEVSKTHPLLPENHIRFGTFFGNPIDMLPDATYFGQCRYVCEDGDGNAVLRIKIPSGNPNYALPSWKKLAETFTVLQTNEV